jgi:uncharacterized metal-binding protein YceD (DUF177 family)
VEELKKYNIDIIHLAEKQHEYHYASDSVFFRELEQDLIQSGRFEATLTLEKSSTMLRLDFSISGVAEQECDRTLERYDEPFETQNRLFLKFGDHDEELTDEIEMIHRNTARINVAKYIYDFIALALPVKRLHPSLRRDENDADEDILIYETDSEAKKSESEEEVDPRWEALKKINKNR